MSDCTRGCDPYCNCGPIRTAPEVSIFRRALGMGRPVRERLLAYAIGGGGGLLVNVVLFGLPLSLALLCYVGTFSAAEIVRWRVGVHDERKRLPRAVARELLS